MAHGQNCKLAKGKVDEMAICQIEKLTKWQVYEVVS
jgi:hypothetical protein